MTPAPAARARRAPRPRHRVEYAAFRMLAGAVSVAPERWALALGWTVAAVLYYGLRFRRHETLRRIRAVFGDAPAPAPARRIAWRALRNLAFNAVEMLRIRTLSLRALRRRIPDFDATLAALRQASAGGGAVIAIPHMGNWDLAGSGCALGGFRIFSIAARQRNPLMNDYINRLRARHGMDILERGAGALRQAVDRLRAGDLFAILPDTRSRHPELTVRFLGGEANLARGMASFARTAGVPIVPVTMVREGWRRFRITIHAPVPPDGTLERAADLARMTQQVADVLDAAIREHPEQWFWYNKRWVLDPL